MQAHLLRYAVGLGAGAAAALLYLAALRGASLGVALAYVGPLPIMIATLGWGFDAGLIAALAAFGVAAAVAPSYAPVYALVIAGPAWAISALAGAPLSRRRKVADDETPPPRRYLGPSGIALVAAALFIGGGGAQLLLMLSAKGGYAAAAAELARQIRQAFDASGAARALPPDTSLEELAAALAPLAPTAFAASATMMHLFNLYVAARSVQISQRLRRPWSDIPSGFQLPRWLAAPALGGLALALVGSAPADQVGLLFAAPLGALYALQGLATLHALSRRHAARPFMLAALYFALLIATEWIAPALAVVGLIESFAYLRARAARSVKPGT